MVHHNPADQEKREACHFCRAGEGDVRLAHAATALAAGASRARGSSPPSGPGAGSSRTADDGGKGGGWQPRAKPHRRRAARLQRIPHGLISPPSRLEAARRRPHPCSRELMRQPDVGGHETRQVTRHSTCSRPFQAPVCCEQVTTHLGTGTVQAGTYRGSANSPSSPPSSKAAPTSSPQCKRLSFFSSAQLPLAHAARPFSRD